MASKTKISGKPGDKNIYTSAIFQTTPEKAENVLHLIKKSELLGKIFSSEEEIGSTHILGNLVSRTSKLFLENDRIFLTNIYHAVVATLSNQDVEMALDNFRYLVEQLEFITDL